MTIADDFQTAKNNNSLVRITSTDNPDGFVGRVRDVESASEAIVVSRDGRDSRRVHIANVTAITVL